MKFFQAPNPCDNNICSTISCCHTGRCGNRICSKKICTVKYSPGSTHSAVCTCSGSSSLFGRRKRDC